MNNLESGLYLPIRFYHKLSEQDRLKRHSVGVALTELNYPYVDCSTLAPFQVSFSSGDVITGITLFAYCIGSTESVELSYSASDWQEFTSDDGIYYLSYLGTSDFTGLLSNGLYYLELSLAFSDTSLTFYSDLFMVGNCISEAYETSEYRVTDQRIGISTEFMRLIDTTDLRITKR